MGPRSPLRFGRCRTDVPRTSCGLRSASVVAEQTSPGRLAVSAPLRSLQNRRPPDVLRSPLRFGRRRADIPRMSCAPSSARLRLLRGRRPWFKVSPPARSARGMRSPGPHSVSAPLRSLRGRLSIMIRQERKYFYD